MREWYRRMSKREREGKNDIKKERVIGRMSKRERKWERVKELSSLSKRRIPIFAIFPHALPSSAFPPTISMPSFPIESVTATIRLPLLLPPLFPHYLSILFILMSSFPSPLHFSTFLLLSHCYLLPPPSRYTFLFVTIHVLPNLIAQLINCFHLLVNFQSFGQMHLSKKRFHWSLCSIPFPFITILLPCSYTHIHTDTWIYLVQTLTNFVFTRHKNSIYLIKLLLRMCRRLVWRMHSNTFSIFVASGQKGESFYRLYVKILKLFLSLWLVNLLMKLIVFFGHLFQFFSWNLFEFFKVYDIRELNIYIYKFRERREARWRISRRA